MRIRELESVLISTAMAAAQMKEDASWSFSAASHSILVMPQENAKQPTCTTL
jgi:hypothetical protein